MRIRYIFLATLFLASCGDNGGNPLERTYGLVGTSYCDEVNQLFKSALQTHLTKTEADAQQVYSSALHDMLGSIREFFHAEQLTADSEAVASEIFDENGLAHVERLEDCSDLLAVQDMLTRNNLGSPSSYDPSLKGPGIFRLFTQAFARNLDAFSDYLPPMEATAMRGYNFGVSLNLATVSWYNDKPSSTEIFAVDTDDNPLHIHDEILEVSHALRSPDDSDAASMDKVETFFQSKASVGLQASFTYSPLPYLKVKVKRATTGQTESVTLFRRESNRVPLVSAEAFAGNIIYTRLQQFDSGAAPELLKKVKNIRETLNAAKPPTIILDLRWNRGGDVSEMTDIASLFLEPGTYGRVKRRQGSNIQEELLILRGKPVFKDEPLIVLVNHGSASASDILTQILKESGRAFVIGETSFGKGIGQDIFALGEGSHLGGAFKITRSQFYGPSGETIQMTGNHVNLEVTDPKIELLKLACGPKCVLRMSDIPSRIGRNVPPTGTPLKPIFDLPKVTKTEISSNAIDAGLKAAKNLSSPPNDIVLETTRQIILKLSGAS
jgi:hypothetical protein